MQNYQNYPFAWLRFAEKFPFQPLIFAHFSKVLAPYNLFHSIYLPTSR